MKQISEHCWVLLKYQDVFNNFKVSNKSLLKNYVRDRKYVVNAKRA